MTASEQLRDMLDAAGRGRGNVRVRAKLEVWLPGEGWSEVDGEQGAVGWEARTGAGALVVWSRMRKAVEDRGRRNA